MKIIPGVLFLFLKAFRSTGGIEKVNRTLLRALFEFYLEQKASVRAASPYAIQPDERYFPREMLKGYGGARWRFLIDMLWRDWKSDLVLVGHVNLAPAVWLLKKRYPGLKIAVMAHGIEVWTPLTGFKRHLLHQADHIIAVSRFTAGKLITVQGLPAEKIKVLPNCLDPFFQLPDNFSKPGYLLQRYGLRPGQPVLITISRLNAHEGYKGYDKVLACLPGLIAQYPDLQYILAGKSDRAERARIKALVQALKLESHVHLPGYLPDEELADHYRLSDVFVMPSKKEGFGLVFIEALACGTPVVAGNADGSADALLDGRLGRLVAPDDPEAIAEAIRQSLLQPGDPLERQKAVKAAFNYSDYKDRLERLLFPPA